MFIRSFLFMHCPACIADHNFWDVTWSGFASSDLAPSFLAGHVDVPECLLWDYPITPICDSSGVSLFKLLHVSHPGHLPLDHPITDNYSSMTSAAKSINVLGIHPSSLHRSVPDDVAIDVHLKRRLLARPVYKTGMVCKRRIYAWLEYLVETPLYKFYDVRIAMEELGRVREPTEEGFKEV
ncbi:hypothetical protein HPB49_008913 [Dermacentor silvarum]|uniref:Uncharacterized protein n=1 Tax=Dermacentor silvarum TaxID=543639 RepID=A0ACB8DY02_DERSI|nr:hypothetical protein HPB49_008913 [Dermacentor silvarum]